MLGTRILCYIGMFFFRSNSEESSPDDSSSLIKDPRLSLTGFSAYQRKKAWAFTALRWWPAGSLFSSPSPENRRWISRLYRFALVCCPLVRYPRTGVGYHHAC